MIGPRSNQRQRQWRSEPSFSYCFLPVIVYAAARRLAAESAARVTGCPVDGVCHPSEAETTDCIVVAHVVDRVYGTAGLQKSYNGAVVSVAACGENGYCSVTGKLADVRMSTSARMEQRENS